MSARVHAASEKLPEPARTRQVAIEAALRPILARELLQQAPRRMPTRSVKALGPNGVWSSDLMDLTSMGYSSKELRNFRYLVCVVDVYSRRAWAVPLKDKTAASVTTAIQTVIGDAMKTSGSGPKHLWCDQGKEFVNKQMDELMDEIGCTRYHTYGPHKSAIAERMIRTLRANLARMSLETGRRDPIEMLSEIIDEYNHRMHSTTGCTPLEVYLGDRLPESERAQPPAPTRTEGELLPLGMPVRISTVRGPFSKGSQAEKFSREIFYINRVVPPREGEPEYYYLEDESGEPIEGVFYRHELLPTAQDPSHFIVERIIKREPGRTLVQVAGVDPKQPHAQKWIATAE